jgi:hypothetical protein
MGCMPPVTLHSRHVETVQCRNPSKWCSFRKLPPACSRQLGPRLTRTIWQHMTEKQTSNQRPMILQLRDPGARTRRRSPTVTPRAIPSQTNQSQTPLFDPLDPGTCPDNPEPSPSRISPPSPNVHQTTRAATTSSSQKIEPPQANRQTVLPGTPSPHWPGACKLKVRIEGMGCFWCRLA